MFAFVFLQPETASRVAMHGPLLAVAFASLLVLCTCGVVRDGKPPNHRGLHRHDSIMSITSPPSDHSKMSSLRSWSFIEGLHTKNTCQDDTCSSSPYKLFPRSTINPHPALAGPGGKGASFTAQWGKDAKVVNFVYGANERRNQPCFVLTRNSLCKKPGIFLLSLNLARQDFIH